MMTVPLNVIRYFTYGPCLRATSESKGNIIVVPQQCLSSARRSSDQGHQPGIGFFFNLGANIGQRLVEIRKCNVFAELMEAVKVASLGQISAALYEVGGQYRRNM